MVGYGTQKRVNLTGAISTVSDKDLAGRPATSAAHMLQGKVPGLNITTSSGTPGNAASINIRGTNSINGGSPLVLVDGVEGDLQSVNSADMSRYQSLKMHRQPLSTVPVHRSALSSSPPSRAQPARPR